MSLLAPLAHKHQPANFNPADYGLTAAEGRQARGLMHLLGEENHGTVLIQ